jgi:hypothetical protein
VAVAARSYSERLQYRHDTAGKSGNIAPKARQGAGDLWQFLDLFSCGYGNFGE